MAEDCLPRFGDYQDAMKADDDFLFHAGVSPYLNLGLLTAGEVCEAALAAWRSQAAPLNAVEGFVRQVLGWREYVRGVYWARMPDYAATNHLEAARPLPAFYWTGATAMACVRACVETTRRNAYAHHIQRLMVTGNLALLAGIAPREVEEWYLSVYADACEWVELPNTHGMALYADGGLLASKPYAASGAYIDRMSDYCVGCAFTPKLREGDAACPFTNLYWHFLVAHERQLGRNPRMALAYRNLARMGDDVRREIVARARAILDDLDSPALTTGAPSTSITTGPSARSRHCRRCPRRSSPPSAGRRPSRWPARRPAPVAHAALPERGRAARRLPTSVVVRRSPLGGLPEQATQQVV